MTTPTTDNASKTPLQLQPQTDIVAERLNRIDQLLVTVLNNQVKLAANQIQIAKATGNSLTVTKTSTDLTKDVGDQLAKLFPKK